MNVVLTVGITNPSSRYTLSAFKLNTHIHNKKVERVSN